MLDTSTILLGTLVPVLFGLALGYYAGRRGRVDNKNITALNVTLMHFILPCSLFLGIGRTPSAVLRSQSSLLAVLSATMVITYVVAYFFVRKVLCKPRREASVQALTVSFANNVAVGIPLLSAMFGPAGLVAVAAAIVAGVLVISPITLVLLECGDADAEANAVPLLPRLGRAVSAALRRPVILAPLCALVFPLSGHTLPVALATSLDLVGKATVGLALFLTGLILSAHPIRLSAGVIIGVFLKNVTQPLLLILLILLFHLHGAIARQAFILAAIPAGFFGTVFGARYGVSSREASSTLVLSTLASVATLPLAVAWSAHLP